MRLREYLQQYKVTISEGEILLAEELYEIPKLEKQKLKKLNPKTNRMKTSRKTKFHKTKVAPKDRTLKNLPRYSDNKSIVRSQDWLEIDTSKSKAKNWGWGCDGKCYGWSHRAVFGFSKGHKVNSKDHIGRDTKRKLPYTIKSDKNAEQHAIRFAKEVS